MKNLYRTAQQFLHLLKKSDEDLSQYLIESRPSFSKKTPTQFLDREKNFLSPLVRNFRLDMTETAIETRNLLHDALVAQTQINNFVSALEAADQSMTQINRNLAVAQRNEKERSRLVSETRNLFIAILPSIKKARQLSDFSLVTRLLQNLSSNISGLENTERAIQKAEQKLRTIEEMSSFSG